MESGGVGETAIVVDVEVASGSAAIVVAVGALVGLGAVLGAGGGLGAVLGAGGGLGAVLGAGGGLGAVVGAGGGLGAVLGAGGGLGAVVGAGGGLGAVVGAGGGPGVTVGFGGGIGRVVGLGRGGCVGAGDGLSGTEVAVSPGISGAICSDPHAKRVNAANAKKVRVARENRTNISYGRRGIHLGRAVGPRATAPLPLPCV